MREGENQNEWKTGNFFGIDFGTNKKKIGLGAYSNVCDLN